MTKQTTQTSLFPESRIKFLDNALLINDKQSKILVIADLHMGYEESVVETGIFPRVQAHDIIASLSRIFDKLHKQGIIKLDKIIILGDLKHEHGKISDAEWRETLYVLDFISKKAKQIILIKGNHDNILGPIANKRNIQITPFYKYDNILFMHGHKEYKTAFKIPFKIFILAHLHPAITLSDEYKKEKYKCFLFGKYKKKQTYILPSFNPISIGYDLNFPCNKNKEFLIIPENKFKNFNIIIYNPKEDKAYDFGKLKKLM